MLTTFSASVGVFLIINYSLLITTSITFAAQIQNSKYGTEVHSKDR
jgi:hypothetical protein